MICKKIIVALRSWRQSTTRLLRDDQGAIALKLALLAPLLFMIVGGTIDYMRFSQQQSLIQRAADAAALAAASEVSLSDANRKNLQAVAATVADRWLASNMRGSADAPAVTAQFRDNPMEVDVVVTGTFNSAFGGWGINPGAIRARAVARIVGRPNICVLALEADAPEAVHLERTAHLTGNNCAVFSNSLSTSGISVLDNATMSARTICSAGGGNIRGDVTPPPYLDCPQFADPLASRPEPTPGPCIANNLMITSGQRTLMPGTYCDGLRILGNANVTFAPGTYIIQGDDFRVDGRATIQGAGVSFFLAQDVDLKFGINATVSLAASTSGPLAGLLIFSSRSTDETDDAPEKNHRILSRNAQTLVGTIYLPTSLLIVDGDANVAGASAWTAIIARRLVLRSGPRLVLNSDYDATDVPVPDGIRGVAPVALAQ